MFKALTIAGKDLRSYFVTPSAYIVITAYLFLSGFFFFTLLQQYNPIAEQAMMMKELSPNLNEWVIYPFFSTMEIVLLFLIPILTMRSISEERSLGTFEMLITSPLSAGDIILGKSLALAVITALMVMFSAIFPGVLLIFADPEAMPIFIGLGGLLLFSWAFSCLGIAISSFTKSQTISGVVSLVVFLVFFVIAAPAEQLTGNIHAVFKYLSPANHAESLLKGVVKSSDIFYFFSIMAVGLFVANRTLDAERWR